MRGRPSASSAAARPSRAPPSRSLAGHMNPSIDIVMILRPCHVSSFRFPVDRARGKESSARLRSDDGPDPRHGRRRLVSPSSQLDDYLLELSGKPRPRIGFLPTAGGEQPEGIQPFHDAFTGRECEPSHLELFGTPERPWEWVLAQDVVYVCGEHCQRTRALARPRRRPGAARALGAWRRPRGLERRRDLLVPGRPHRLVRPALRALDDGLGFLSGSFCPHYDGEPERRPTFTRLVADGVLPAGLAADDDAAILFEGTEFREVVSQREEARGYRVGIGGEEPLEARALWPVS